VAVVVYYVTRVLSNRGDVGVEVQPQSLLGYASFGNHMLLDLVRERYYIQEVLSDIAGKVEPQVQVQLVWVAQDNWETPIEDWMTSGVEDMMVHWM